LQPCGINQEEREVARRLDRCVHDQEEDVRMSRYRRTAALAAATAVLAGSLGGGGAVAQDQVEFTFYDNHHLDPGQAFIKEAVAEYMAENPNVTINVEFLENALLKQEVSNDMQAGDPPDLFQGWGGGTLAQQVEAGLVRPIDDEIADIKDQVNAAGLSMTQVDGKQYGVPYNLGAVGIWYNKDLFTQAGIDAPPATWEELLADVQTFKDAGIVPISLAAGTADAWTAMFWFAYLSVRICGQEGMNVAITTGDWSGDCFVRAAQELQRLVEMEPFQAGFLAATHPAQEGEFGNGKAAMMLQGQWAASSQASESESKKGIGDALGWFPFPLVDGGAGLATDVFGGGDNFIVGRDAPPEAVEFAKWLTTDPDIVAKWVASGDAILPTLNGSESLTTDPNMQSILEARSNATFAQGYLDQVTSPELGGEINRQVEGLVGGAVTPEEAVQGITAAAQAQ
jgi:raffinose/stachyose/melibiose transport system substrate-binding protein